MPTRKNTQRATGASAFLSRSTSGSNNAGNKGSGRKGDLEDRSAGRGTSARVTSQSGARGLKNGEPRHLQYSKWIDSPDEHEDCQGQSLATRNHDVILQWAHLRKALPSVVGDTARRDGAGVLRIDFPAYGGKRLKKIGWDRWFHMFDKRKLVFLYQERNMDGSKSIFFKLAA